MLIFTPPGSSRAMGTIMVPEPRGEAMTPAEYRTRLATRIQAMVDDLDPREAEHLLNQAEDQENLSLDVAHAGEILVESSGFLNEAAAIPVVPIPASAFRAVPETEEALQEDNLEDYLGQLYRMDR